MSLRTNQEYLKNEQYKDSANLIARINLHRLFSTNPENWFRWVFDHIIFQRAATLLELGCGPGMLWENNRGRIPTNWYIHLSDISPGMLQDAQIAANHTGSKFSFCTLDAQSIPYQSATFDLVIANHMLYHIPDRPNAISEIHRVLKSGGRLIAATNGLHHMAEIRDLLNRVYPENISIPYYAFGVNEFTIENGAEQLTPWFYDIQNIPFEDSLEVTDPDPLIAYIYSMNADSNFDFNTNQINALKKLITQKINSHGSFHITKSTALFVATKIG